MYRCFDLPEAPVLRRAALCLAIIAIAIAPATAQVQRNFPAAALRGNLAFGQPPEVVLNGTPTRLSPGSRVRGPDNLLQMTAALLGTRYVVNYTLDTLGQPRDVWILRPEEADVRPWPRTPQEAAEWLFDPAAQRWSKP